MTDDPNKDDSTPDPWADLESGSPSEAAEEFSFSFDEPAAMASPAEPPAADEPAVMPVEEPVAEAAGARADAELEEDLVGSWLDEDAGPAEPATLSVFSPDDAGSSIEIGTGHSGIAAADEADVWGEAQPPVDDGAGQAAEPSADSFGLGEFGESSESGGVESSQFVAAEAETVEPGIGIGEGEAFAAAAGTAASAVTARAASRPAKAGGKKKAGGLGQMIGVVLGGVMAIPITLAILIWGLKKDPFKVTKMVPESVAFLLPQQFQPGFKKSGASARSSTDGPSPLDALGTAGDAGSGESPAHSDDPLAGGIDESVASIPMTEPAVPPAGAGEGEEAAVDPAGLPGEEPYVDPLASDAQPVVPPVPAPAPEPKPLDMSGLDAALTESATALDAVKAVVDPDDPTRKRLVVDWYKSLAKVAEQLVLLETVAADSGRPLSGPPDQFVALRESLAGSEADLTRLGRNWLGFANRTSDGVILPVTFQSSRRVGPYWSTKVSIDLAKGGVRDLVVLSRTEPAAVVGDRILLTGMAFDGDVIWAADIRPASAAAGLGSESL